VTTSKSILIFGKTKIGKTLDVCYAFRKAFVMLAEPGGLDSVESNLGFMPNHRLLTDLDNPFIEATNMVNNIILPGCKSGAITCVVIDTGSELADRFATAAISQVGIDARKWSPLVQRWFKSIIRPILSQGVWTVMICHEQRADDFSGRPGGPKLPGALTEAVPAMYSLILHAVVKPTVDGYGRFYECDPLNPTWNTGDRFGVTEDSQPMELLPLIFKIQRPDEEVPEKFLRGKPIRRGGKVYQPEELAALVKKSAADDII